MWHGWLLGVEGGSQGPGRQRRGCGLEGSGRGRKGEEGREGKVKGGGYMKER